MEMTKREIEVKSMEEARAVEEEATLKKDKIQTIDRIKREEEDLVAKTKTAKDKMDDLLKRQSSVGRSLAGREAELEAAIRSKALAEKNLSDFEKQATEFLRNKVQELTAKRDFQEAERARAIKEYKEAKQKVQELHKEGTAKAKKILQRLDKE